MAKKTKKEKYIHISDDGRYRVQIRPSKKIKDKFDEYFETLEQAKDERDKFLARQKLGLDSNTNKGLTLSDFCDEYFEWYKNKPRKPSPNTLRDYACRIRNIKRYFKNAILYKITSAEIERFLIHESNRKKLDPSNPEKELEETLSSNSVHHAYVMLRILFKKAVLWKKIKENPMDAVEEPKFRVMNKAQIIPFESFEDVKEIIDKYASLRDRLIFFLGLCGGIREEEVCGIHCTSEFAPKSDDNLIDFKNYTVELKYAVKQNYDTGEYEEYELKSESSERTIPLPDFVIECIKEYLKYRDQLVKMFKAKYGDKYRNLPNLFLNKDGDFFRPRYVGKLWAKFKKKHDIKAKFHELRHSYITYQMNYNPDITPSEVQILAGHAHISTTYGYVHESDDKLKKAANIFNNIYNNKIDINEDNTICAPIMYVASIITGVEYVDINKMIDFLKIVNPNKEITYKNLSSSIDDTKEHLLINYPSLENLLTMNRKYSRDDFENKAKQVYGNKFLLEPINDIELERC